VTRALIVGSEGQDGQILFDRLSAEGCVVVGIGRGTARSSNGTSVKPVDIGSREQVQGLIKQLRPDEIYYLAAVHQASQDPIASDDATLFERSLEAHVTGLIHILGTLGQFKQSRLFYAGSSLVFGDALEAPQDEQTPFRPKCIYGITKAAAINICDFYRRKHGFHISAGFLYNHESLFRRPNFVSGKIIRAAVAIAAGSHERLELGDLGARVDWGYAPDFIDAMIRIVRNPDPGNYVIATGEAHTVQEFVEVAFSEVGIDWRSHVTENRGLLTRPSVPRVGNSARLREHTCWRPSVTFVQMVQLLTRAARQTNAS
jgi:GDPmannose 4,6-dehydratase